MPEKLFLFYFGNNASANGTAAFTDSETQTFFDSDRGDQFYFRTTDVTGDVTLPDGVEMVMPGDNIDMAVELITPIAIEPGLRFAIREGGRTVGSGVVIAINE